MTCNLDGLLCPSTVSSIRGCLRGDEHVLVLFIGPLYFGLNTAFCQYLVLYSCSRTVFTRGHPEAIAVVETVAIHKAACILATSDNLFLNPSPTLRALALASVGRFNSPLLYIYRLQDQPLGGVTTGLGPVQHPNVPTAATIDRLRACASSGPCRARWYW